MSTMDVSGWGFATKAIHVGQEPDPTSSATVPPINLSSTFTQSSPGKHKGYEYARSGNPTRGGLERCLAAIEGGVACASFASGSAASTAIIATLSPGDKVLAYGDVYGGTFRLLKKVFEKYGVAPVFTDDVAPAAFANLIDDKTKLLVRLAQRRIQQSFVLRIVFAAGKGHLPAMDAAGIPENHDDVQFSLVGTVHGYQQGGIDHRLRLRFAFTTR